jgi:hypothetical protein
VAMASSGGGTLEHAPSSSNAPAATLAGKILRDAVRMADLRHLSP